jgi:glucosyl-3-phosphoglycerate phosphatase
MSHIVLVRHGESAWNASSRLQGQADAPLSDLGRDQARALRTALSALPGMGVVSSDLARARVTGELAGFSGPALDSRWRERGLGVWEGLLEAEVDPAALAAFRTTDEPPAGGEPWPDFQARVGRAVDELAGRGGDWLVFTHGGCVRAAVAHLTGARPKTIAGPGNASLSVLQAGDRARLLVFNWSAEAGGTLKIRPPSDPGGAEPTVSARMSGLEQGSGGALPPNASS